MRRKLSLRTVVVQDGEPVSGHNSKIFEVEGRQAFRVFYVEIGRLTLADAHKLLHDTTKHVQESRPEGYAEDIIIPMQSGVPRARVEVWEEVGAAGPDRVISRSDLLQLLQSVYAELARNQVALDPKIRAAVYDNLWELYE